MSARRGEMLLVVSAIGFGVSTALTVAALRGLGPADMLAVELGGPAVILGVRAAATGRLQRRGVSRALAQGAVLPGLTYLLANLGLARTTATSGSLLLGAETLVTVGLAVLVLRERLGVAGIVALVLGLAGTGLVSLGGAATDTTTDQMVGNLLVIAAVVCGAAYVVWSRWSAQPSGEGLGLTTWQFVGATAAVSPFVLTSWATGGSRIGTARPEHFVAAVAVLGCGLGALLAFNTSIAVVTASRAALLLNLQPVAGAVTAVAVLGEAIGPGQAVGGVLILLGLLVLTRGRPAQTTTPGPPVPAQTSAPAHPAGNRGRHTQPGCCNDVGGQAEVVVSRQPGVPVTELTIDRGQAELGR